MLIILKYDIKGGEEGQNIIPDDFCIVIREQSSLWIKKVEQQNMNIQTHKCATRFHKAKRFESNNWLKKTDTKNEMYTQQHCLYDNGFSYYKECVCSVLHNTRKRPCTVVDIICIRYAYCRWPFFCMGCSFYHYYYSFSIQKQFFFYMCVFHLFSFFCEKIIQ